MSSMRCAGRRGGRYQRTLSSACLPSPAAPPPDARCTSTPWSVHHATHASIVPFWARAYTGATVDGHHSLGCREAGREATVGAQEQRRRAGVAVMLVALLVACSGGPAARGGAAAPTAATA